MLSLQNMPGEVIGEEGVAPHPRHFLKTYLTSFYCIYPTLAGSGLLPDTGRVIFNMSKKNAAPLVRRPDNTAFTQQRLPAWQPLLSAGIVLPSFFFFGLVFIGIGVGLYFSSKSIQEVEVDYTNCDEKVPLCTPESCTCLINFTISQFIQGPIFMYYGLTNFYQNARRYQTSRDDAQLSGDLYSLKNPSSSCAPFQYDNKSIPVAPCGAVANSMFSDTFNLSYLINGTKKAVQLDNKGISWWSDYNIKFRNPNNTNGSVAELKAIFDGTAKPPRWPKPAYELDVNDPYNNGFINEDFLVWMRAAALPNFRKLYRRIERDNFTLGLPAGDYQLAVNYTFPVKSFNGTKKVIFSSVSWMGGKNPFLGIVYLVCGALCILGAFIMLVVHLKFQCHTDSPEM